MRYLLLFLLLPVLLSAQQPHAVTDATPLADDDAAPPVSIVLEMKGYGTGRSLTAEPSPLRAQFAPLPVDPVYSKKSPFLAALFSALLPRPVEGGLWYFNIDQTQQGDDQTASYQAYADGHWSIVKYAEWLNENVKDFEGGENAVHITINPDASLPPWERVDWDALHTTELAVPVFSHKLPPHGDQQYYELIGKYNQYSYGWDDKNDGSYWNVSDNFLYYASERGKANDFYNTADTILNLIILNHVLSAIDAAWAAARFNKFVDLYASTRLLRLPSGDAALHTTAQLSVRF